LKTTDGTPHKILSVGNDPEILTAVRSVLGEAGYDVSDCFSVEKAIGILEFDRVDMVVCEMEMPVVSGIDLLRYVKENFSDVEMMLYGRQDVETAVKAIKGGAEDYLTRPFHADELAVSVRKMADKIALRRNSPPRIPGNISHGIIGGCPAMQEVSRMIEKAAASLVNVLIVGESGTGKELVARAIHYNGDRSRAPFVSVNCTAIPDTLLESELFGHVRGAFTGARESRSGFFQIADGGTIFLDEIGDASLNMQGKLLRVLQNKEIHMVGSSRVRRVDTRIIAATHKDLGAMVARGQFREDLFYRLNVIDVAVPPLRDRKDDILFLIHHFNEKFSREADRSPPPFSDEILQVMKAYHWPGNVRELENLVQRLVVMVDGPLIRMTDMPPHMRCQIAPRVEGLRTLFQVEAAHIRRVLQAVGENKTRAARILGIDRKTLRTKLQQEAEMGRTEPGNISPAGNFTPEN
jgi:DNA-binding NtrC family response regulator